jgi:hypothetical protein
MTGKTVPEPQMEAMPPLLTCEVCLEEIPSSEDFISEARDYVVYFCGLDCYAQWHEFATKKDSRGMPEKAR